MNGHNTSFITTFICAWQGPMSVQRDLDSAEITDAVSSYASFTCLFDSGGVGRQV